MRGKSYIKKLGRVRKALQGIFENPDGFWTKRQRITDMVYPFDKNRVSDWSFGDDLLKNSLKVES